MTNKYSNKKFLKKMTLKMKRREYNTKPNNKLNPEIKAKFLNSLSENHLTFSSYKLNFFF